MPKSATTPCCGGWHLGGSCPRRDRQPAARPLRSGCDGGRAAASDRRLDDGAIRSGDILSFKLSKY